MSQIVIVAKITVKEEFTNEVYSYLKELYKNTHQKDKGCIQYELHKNLENPNSFTFIETWENSDFLDTHMQKEHFVSFVSKVENKLETLEINKLEKEDI